jgi:hypothetical protein
MKKLMEATEDLSRCSQHSYQHPETLNLQNGGMPTSEKKSHFMRN